MRGGIGMKDKSDFPLFGWIFGIGLLIQIGEDVFTFQTSDYLWWMNVVFFAFLCTGYVCAITQFIKSKL